MGKFTYLNADEIVSHVEKFGTDDERDIVRAFKRHDFDADCSGCEMLENKIDEIDEELFSVNSFLEDIEDVTENDLSNEEIVKQIKGMISERCG